MREADLKQLLPRIACPVLFVVGASDLKTHEKVLEAAVLVVFAGAQCAAPRSR